MARRRRSVTAVTTPFDSCIAAMWAKANTVHLGGTGLLAWPPGLSLCHAERARPPPIFPSAHQPRHHRILLDIANDLGQLFRPPHPMIVRFILPKRQAGASALAKPERIGNHLRHSFIHQFKMEPSGTGGRSIQAPVHWRRRLCQASRAPRSPRFLGVTRANLGSDPCKRHVRNRAAPSGCQCGRFRS
jgi:hypothetical protein